VQKNIVGLSESIKSLSIRDNPGLKQQSKILISQATIQDQSILSTIKNIGKSGIYNTRSIKFIPEVLKKVK
jgi:hypothetical protein